ncbi:MAG TPA: hypothetical protein VF240_20275 [Pyrinomonadaceae bacterium]
MFIVACVAIALFKLWLVRGEEVGYSGSYFDDVWYVQSAKDWYWLRSYRELSFDTQPYIRLPAYPLYIALANLTGFPLRIVNELLFLLVAFAFSWVLVKAGLRRFLCLVLYVAIVLHPGSFAVNSVLSPDPFFASVLLGALAGMILLFVKRGETNRVWYGSVAGLALAVLWHARQENIIVLGLLVVYVLLLLLVLRERGSPWASTLKELSVVAGVPVAVVLMASLAVKTINYQRFGVFAADAMFTSDFERATKALLRIKPAVPLRYVPVPREVRERAYEVSPAFRELRPFFEGNVGRTWASFGKDAGVQAEGEISAGHVWWALNQGTYQIGYNKSARQAGRFYKRIADEVNAACDDGRLACRTVFSSLIDPHVQNYWPHLPGSLVRMTSLFTSTAEVPKPRDANHLPPDLRVLFDSVTNRRTALQNPPAMRIRGWAFNPGDKLQGVLVRNQDGRVLAGGRLTPRHDVAAAFTSQNGTAPLDTGFDLLLPPSSPMPYNADLVFTTGSGKELIVRRPGGAADSPGPGLTYHVDEDMTFPDSHRLELATQSYIWSVHGKIIMLLTYAGLCALLLALIFFRSVKLREPAVFVSVLLAAAIVSRLALFTLIDAAAYIAAEIRYIFPVTYLYTCLLLILIHYSLSLVTARLDGSSVLQRIDIRKLLKKTMEKSARWKQEKPRTGESRQQVG